MAPPNRADRHFDTSWETIHEEFARLYAIHTMRISPLNPLIERVVKRGAAGMMTDFAARKELQHQVFTVLRREIGAQPTDVTDLLAGDAAATLPLVMCGTVSNLHTIDSGHSEMYLKMPAAAAKKLKIGGKIHAHTLKLGHATQPGDLPQTARMTLIESGVGLPPEARVPNAAAVTAVDAKLEQRSSHIFGPEVSLDDILRIAGGTHGRILDIFDTPFFKRPRDLASLREFVEAAVAQRPEWKVATWEAAASGSPMYHAKLVHE